MSHESRRWIYKDSDQLVSHCRCDVGISGCLPQLDCPWCGCGWLFTCAKCRKAFTFGRIDHIDEPELGLIARQQASLFTDGNPSPEAVALILEDFAALVKGHDVGERVVVLDGVLISADHAGALKLAGLHAHHDLAWLPQRRAIEHPTVMSEILANGEYWHDRRIERE